MKCSESTENDEDRQLEGHWWKWGHGGGNQMESAGRWLNHSYSWVFVIGDKMPPSTQLIRMDPNVLIRDILDSVPAKRQQMSIFHSEMKP